MPDCPSTVHDAANKEWGMITGGPVVHKFRSGNSMQDQSADTMAAMQAPPMVDCAKMCASQSLVSAGKSDDGSCICKFKSGMDNDDRHLMM